MEEYNIGCFSLRVVLVVVVKLLFEMAAVRRSNEVSLELKARNLSKASF